MRKKPTISVLMLTKDSRSNLIAALNSASPYADKIIIADTGSIDDTPQIAARSGAEVYFFKWIDDFSAARNFALKHIHTDWVFMLDSDELISNFDLNLFYRYAANSNIGGINIIIDNTLDNKGNQIQTTHRYTRLFRNHPEIKFTGRIHEQIRGSIESLGLDVKDSDFSILHLGYSNFNEEKNQRNLKLLADDAKENPHDDWLQYHLAETNFNSGNIEEAGEIYMKILNSNQLSTHQQEMVRLRLAQISMKYDSYEPIIKLTDFTSTNNQNEALRYYIRGTSMLFLKDYHGAVDCYEKCLEINSPSLVKNDIISAMNTAKKLM